MPIDNKNKQYETERLLDDCEDAMPEKVDRVKWYKMHVKFHEGLNDEVKALFHWEKTVLVRSTEGRELKYTKTQYAKVCRLDVCKKHRSRFPF